MKKMKKLAINPSNKKYYSEEYIKGWEDGVKAQYEATIDAVEEVRCRECKHRETDDCPMYWMEWLIIEDCDGYADDHYIVHDYTKDDGYCNYGERKGGDDK